MRKANSPVVPNMATEDFHSKVLRRACPLLLARPTHKASGEWELRLRPGHGCQGENQREVFPLVCSLNSTPRLTHNWLQPWASPNSQQSRWRSDAPPPSRVKTSRSPGSCYQWTTNTTPCSWQVSSCFPHSAKRLGLLFSSSCFLSGFRIFHSFSV